METRPLHDADPAATAEVVVFTPGMAEAPPSRPAKPRAPCDEWESVEIWGLRLARLDYLRALDAIDRLIARRRPAFFITANLHYAMLADGDPRLAEVNRRAAFLLADGMPMVWYSRLLKRPLPERIAGADLVYDLCARAADRGRRVYLLGGAAGIADEAARVLQTLYPRLRIVGVESPQLDRLTPQEHELLIARIRRARPDLLLVALGQPKGELWLAQHYETLGVPASVQIGCSLDLVAGRAVRAPRWMQRVGLEWLYRAMREPRRLVPRYWNNARFLAKAVCRDLWRYVCGTTER